MKLEKMADSGMNYHYSYPDEIERLISLQLINFDLWYLLDRKQSNKLKEELDSWGINEQLIPFARRGDNGEIACYNRYQDANVIVLKPCEILGYRRIEMYESIWDWFRAAIEVMISF